LLNCPRNCLSSPVNLDPRYHCFVVPLGL
jgi:hypothetical protein